MKNFTKFLAILVLGLMFSAASLAQSSAIAEAAAEIFAPIAITKTSDLHFGTLAASSTAGTAVIATNGARSATGGVTLLVGVAPTAAAFRVTGIAGANFAFSLPASIVLSSGTNSMTVNTFTNDAPASITGGDITVHVGATLQVTAGQPSGTYTNTTDLEATVNYN